MVDQSLDRTVSAQGIWNIYEQVGSEQFSDRFAFLRELLQNSRDAGSFEMDVMTYCGYVVGADQAEASILVQDYGCGMSEDDFREKALRLFNSEKEDDLTKAGQFGIGLSSLFVFDPNEVIFYTSKNGKTNLFRWQKGSYSYNVEPLGKEHLTEGTLLLIKKCIPLSTIDTLLQSSERGKHKRSALYGEWLDVQCRRTIDLYCRYLEGHIFYSYHNERLNDSLILADRDLLFRKHRETAVELTQPYALEGNPVSVGINLSSSDSATRKYSSEKDVKAVIGFFVRR